MCPVPFTFVSFRFVRFMAINSEMKSVSIWYRHVLGIWRDAVNLSVSFRHLLALRWILYEPEKCSFISCMFNLSYRRALTSFALHLTSWIMLRVKYSHKRTSVEAPQSSLTLWYWKFMSLVASRERTLNFAVSAAHPRLFSRHIRSLSIFPRLASSLCVRVSPEIVSLGKTISLRFPQRTLLFWEIQIESSSDDRWSDKLYSTWKSLS